MTSLPPNLPPNDPLVALWKTAPKPDTQHLLGDLQRLNRLHGRLNRVLVVILSCLSLLFIFEDATGRIPTHGILSAIWILTLVLGGVWRGRARCKRTDAFALDTVSLLKFMIARAKSDLLIARCLYAGVPAAAVFDYLVMELAGTHRSRPPLAVHGQLQLIQPGAAIAILIAMMVAGALLARSRRLQVRELGEKLRLIEGDL